MQITVLGAGLVGNAIVRDLALDNLFDVIAVDRDQHALNRLQQECSAQIGLLAIGCNRRIHLSVPIS